MVNIPKTAHKDAEDVSLVEYVNHIKAKLTAFRDDLASGVLRGWQFGFLTILFILISLSFGGTALGWQETSAVMTYRAAAGCLLYYWATRFFCHVRVHQVTAEHPWQFIAVDISTRLALAFVIGSCYGG